MPLQLLLFVAPLLGNTTDFAPALTLPALDRELIILRPMGPDRSDTYFKLGLGLTTTTDSEGASEEVDFNEGFAIPVGFGWRLDHSENGDPAFDLEIEGTYADQDVSNSGPTQAVRDVTVGALHVNLLGELPISGRLAAYGGGGLGVAWVDIGTSDDGLSTFNDEDGPFFSWQAKLGLRLNSTESLAIDIGYRFMNIDEVRLDDDASSAEFELETEMHVLEASLRLYL